MRTSTHPPTSVCFCLLVASCFLLGAPCCYGQAETAKQDAGAPAGDDLPAYDVPQDQYVSPAEIVRGAFEPPPAAQQLSKRLVWVDRTKKRVYVDGYVTMRDGPLEMFACPVGTKEHESIVATLARASEVHTALLAIGAKPGTPVEFVPSYVPATGQRIRVWVCYRDDQDMFNAIDARRWVRRTGTDQPMRSDWVFAGSGFYKDESTGREYYRADGGDMICVSNFNSAMLDVPIASSQDAGELRFSPFTDRIPSRGTPLRLVLVPVPIPTDNPQPESPLDPDQAPGEEILPRKATVDR